MREENDQLELDELIKDCDVEHSDALLECLSLMADISLAESQMASVRASLANRYCIDESAE